MNFTKKKVKKLCPKSTKKCVEVLEARNQLNNQENLLIDWFRNLLNLKEKEKIANEFKLGIGKNR